MSIGIYKIENLINHKIYIGQSIHIEKRWQQHCQSSTTSLIGKAIQKYGKENFSFEIIVECPEEKLDELESQYIQQYNSLVPNGYNIVLTSPVRTISFTKNNYSILLNIINDLKYSKLSFDDIASKYALDKSMIYYINRGDYHTLPNEIYPIRKVQDMTKKYHYCCDCGKEISRAATRCSSCQHKKTYKTEHPSRTQLKQLIREKSFVAIGKQYGVSDKAIIKWCISYNLPCKKSIIKTINDEDWEKI